MITKNFRSSNSLKSHILQSQMSYTANLTVNFKWEGYIDSRNI